MHSILSSWFSSGCTAISSNTVVLIFSLCLWIHPNHTASCYLFVMFDVFFLTKHTYNLCLSVFSLCSLCVTHETSSFIMHVEYTDSVVIYAFPSNLHWFWCIFCFRFLFSISVLVYSCIYRCSLFQIFFPFLLICVDFMGILTIDYWLHRKGWDYLYTQLQQSVIVIRCGIDKLKVCVCVCVFKTNVFDTLNWFCQ